MNENFNRESPHLATEQPEDSFESRESMDKLVMDTAHELSVLDTMILEGRPIPEGPIEKRFSAAVELLRDKTPDELQSIMDPKGKINPELFDTFHISSHPPGTILIELGTSSDLTKFLTAMEFQQFNDFSNALSGETRELDSFAAMYFPPSHFDVQGFLGVIVAIKEQSSDLVATEKNLRHEYSHAIVREVVHPTCQKRFSDNAVAEQLGLWLNPKIPADIREGVIEKKIKDEQFLLDELRAYTFNFPPLPPKFATTHLDLNTDDAINGLEAEVVKKYFAVYLLHLQSRLRSTQARARSLGILGAAATLEQAARLLESDSKNWYFDPSETDEQFAGRLLYILEYISDRKFMNFQHVEGGELISTQEMKKQLIPHQKMVHDEIARRWKQLSLAPTEVQQVYTKLFSTPA